MRSDSSNTDRAMAEPLPTLRARSKRRKAWGVDGEPELTQGPLGIVWPGILFAAGYYPIVIGGCMMVSWAWKDGLRGLAVDGAIAIFGIFLLSFVLGVIYALIMTIPAFYLTQGLRWSLQGIVSGRGASGIYGGMTGFLCTSGGGLFLIGGVPPLRNWTPSILAMLLAVVMGYVGAIWIGYQKRTEGYPFFEPIFSNKKQIAISFLLKLTFVIALVSVVLKAAGAAGFYIGTAWLVYLLTQTLLLVCDFWITRWLRSR